MIGALLRQLTFDLQLELHLDVDFRRRILNYKDLPNEPHQHLPLDRGLSESQQREPSLHSQRTLEGQDAFVQDGGSLRKINNCQNYRACRALRLLVGRGGAACTAYEDQTRVERDLQSCCYLDWG